MRGALANRLVLAVAAVAVTLGGALGAFVVLPVNGIVDREHVASVERAAALVARLPAGAALPSGSRLAGSVGIAGGGVPTVADLARRGDPRYARTVVRGRQVTVVHGTATGQLLVVTDRRDGAIERQERVGLVISLVLVLAGTMGWALWAGASYARRLGRVARVARQVADGDFAARAALRGGDELARLGGDVDRMARRLGSLEQSRSAFIAKVSHDLRTPLTVIKGYAYTLERGASDADDRRRLGAIGRETDRLTALVDDLLTLSQAGAGALRVTFAPVDVSALLDEVEERVRPLAGERGVTVSALDPVGGHIDGDRRRLAQVLTNLATNAIRHTPEAGTVTLSARHDEEGIDLLVDDTGAGIDPASVERLLRPFEHGGAGGTGLGLAIVTELVAAHGGTFSLAPRPGGGTTARVRLPRGRASVPA
jgi:signal transduction histidine kinase